MITNTGSVMKPEPSAAIWASAPFEPAFAADVQRLLARMDDAQRLWLSGYLAGTVASRHGIETVSEPSRPQVTVLYGSQSGNCEQLAHRAVELLAQRGIAARLLDMIDCRKEDLQAAQVLIVVVSTHGEGDPPDRARPLYDLLHGRKAPKLNHLKYAVLALGDSSYEKFCETGRRFDAQLEALGGTRLCARAECDVDFNVVASPWLDSLVEQLGSECAATGATRVVAPARPIASIATAYTRKNPFHAPLLTNQRLTARASTKDVRHLELSLEGAGIHYEPGDALGVVPRNRAADVDALLAALPFDGEAEVLVSAQSISLREALLERYEIATLTESALARYAAAIGCTELSALLQPERAEDLRRYLHGRDVLDLVNEHPPRGLTASTFAQTLSSRHACTRSHRAHVPRPMKCI